VSAGTRVCHLLRSRRKVLVPCLHVNSGQLQTSNVSTHFYSFQRRRGTDAFHAASVVPATTCIQHTTSAVNSTDKNDLVYCQKLRSVVFFEISLSPNEKFLTCDRSVTQLAQFESTEPQQQRFVPAWISVGQ